MPPAAMDVDEDITTAAGAVKKIKRIMSQALDDLLHAWVLMEKHLLLAKANGQVSRTKFLGDHKLHSTCKGHWDKCMAFVVWSLPQKSSSGGKDTA